MRPRRTRGCRAATRSAATGPTPSAVTTAPAWTPTTTSTRSCSAWCGRRSAERPLLLQPHVLQWARVREAPDQVDPRLGHAGTDAPDEGQLVERHVRHPVVQDLLDLVHERLALLHVRLARLPLHEVLDLGDRARGVDAVLAHVGFETRGRVAAGARDADDDVLQLLLAPRGRHGRPLHRAHPGADAGVLEIRD